MDLQNILQLDQHTLFTIIIWLCAIAIFLFLIDKIKDHTSSFWGRVSAYFFAAVFTVIIGLISTHYIEPLLIPPEDISSISQPAPITRQIASNTDSPKASKPTATRKPTAKPTATPKPTATRKPTAKPTATPKPTKKTLSYISFSGHYFSRDQKFYVYSAPSSSSWYSKTKKGAQVYGSTNDIIYVAGNVGNWLLIKYETTKNNYRMGYTNNANEHFQDLSFDYYSGEITKNCSLTDGVDKKKLYKGDSVTILGKMDTGIYIEAYVNGQQARGTVPESCVNW